jgi:hypothetical protein
MPGQAFRAEEPNTREKLSTESKKNFNSFIQICNSFYFEL